MKPLGAGPSTVAKPMMNRHFGLVLYGSKMFIGRVLGMLLTCFNESPNALLIEVYSVY